jgi:hypothetical protein
MDVTAEEKTPGSSGAETPDEITREDNTIAEETAGKETKDDHPNYPQGIKLVLIMVSILINMFLAALDQVCFSLHLCTMGTVLLTSI